MNSRAIPIVILCASLYHPVQAAQKSQKTAVPAPVRGNAVNDTSDPSDFEFWTSGRYRLTPSDVIELRFPYVTEFDQIITVQPDGYASLRGVGDLRVQSRTLPELRQMLIEAYSPIIRDPAITIVLKEFEKPYFVATGEVLHPGKFELRGATTVTQALAFAGGLSKSAKHSQIVVFRRYSNELLEVKQVDVKRMFASRDLSEDLVLRPGDTLYVPRSRMSQIAPFLPRPGLYLDPVSLFR
jgi:protein involved in polysaccharide export with SLBB domain